MTDAPEIKHIRAGLIFENPTLARSVHSERVKQLAESIKEIGLQNPITVRAKRVSIHGQPADGFEILAGVHRFRAMFNILNYEHIPAIVSTADDLHAKLITIDENLIRQELSEVERAEMLKQRQDIYETLYPETKHGGNAAAAANARWGNASRQNGDTHGSAVVRPKRFTEDAAEKTGRGERSIQRDLEIADKIDAEVRALVKGGPLDTQRYLHLTLKPLWKKDDESGTRERQLAKVQRDLADLSAAQHARKGRKPVAPSDPPRNDIEIENQQHRALVRAWEAAGEAARERFLSDIGAVIDRPVMDRRYA